MNKWGIIVWRNAREQRPCKSGLYAVACKKLNTWCYHTVWYSARHDAWNAFDDLDNNDYAIDVDYWAVLPSVE